MNFNNLKAREDRMWFKRMSNRTGMGKNLWLGSAKTHVKPHWDKVTFDHEGNII